jgi:LuxR family transcriptional regulator, maltose regulon positive regulatory protein
MGEGTATTAKVKRRRIIERPRLTRLLDESQGRIKMLIAPAGYGKTTLARQWLVGKQAVWYTATPASADVAALAAGLRDAVSQVVPGAGDALMERLSVTDHADDEADLLATMVASSLTAWPSGAWLVIDDYHAFLGHAAAEQFAHQLLSDAPLQVLVLSRRRPSWASPRRIVYGELAEIGRRDLAMTPEEAATLFDQSQSSIKDVIAVTQGWPAVVALAAVSHASTEELMAAPNLVSYLAEETFQKLDRQTQRALCELALYDVSGLQAALRRLRPTEAERMTAAWVEHGFLTELSPGEFEMHPLLRGFLELKLREGSTAEVSKTVARAVRLLFSLELWDEAFDIIERFGERTLLVDLIAQAADHLLAQGRTSTLRSWVGAADAAEPPVRHASAELALREGMYHQAETLGVLAARAATDPDGEARSLIVAARAAHVASRQEQALAYYGRASSIATQPQVVWQAKLGELQAAAELEVDDAPARLAQLTSSVPEEPTTRVVLADRTLGIQTRYAVPVNLEVGRAAAQLLTLVPDPMVRTSFRNIFGYALAASANTEEAMQLMNDQIDDAERCRIDFAIPYAQITKALVLTVRREYREATELLIDSHARAIQAKDHTAASVGAAVRARVHIAQGSFETALEQVTAPSTEIPRSLQAEITACRALALAGSGNFAEAGAFAEESLRSVGVEATICGRATKAVTAIHNGDYQSASIEAKLALACAVETGLIESFVAAYRGLPQLVVCLFEEKDAHDDLARVLRLAGDADALPGASTSVGEHSILLLSPREKEVLSLLARGLTNRQIGAALFISPVTVKVHVRHIFDKLGVKSRAEAALRAAQLDRE